MTSAIEQLRDFRCASPDHNDDRDGCSNPECFKFKGNIKSIWYQYDREIDRLWDMIVKAKK